MASVTNASMLTDRTLARQKYPNPFFDLSKVYMPKGIKSILRFCRMFFYRNEFINSVLHKMTEYPITPLLFDNLSDAEYNEKWRTVLYHNLKIKTLLVEIGLDYHVFGNCFLSAVQKFKRHLRCPNCGEMCLADELKELKFVNFNYKGVCPECLSNCEFEIEDTYIKSPESIKFVRWAPEQVEIEYDSLTGDREYYYMMDPAVKRDITAGKISKINKLPKIFIDSVKEGKKIKLDPDNIYHLRRPGLSEEDMSWGKPTILPALSLIWYMQTLRRGNEAIALEHVVPMRAVYPASTGDINPLLQMNLSNWKSRVQEELDKFREDPNYIGVFPIPLGYQSLGGDARALLTTPELKFLEETIINSLGIPIEFVKGGSTWTGSSISLRIVENGFLSYREYLEDMLNYFIIPKIAGMLSYPEIKVKFKRFRMADDTETKNLAIQLNSMGKLSDSMLIQDFGYDPDENYERIQKDVVANGMLDIKRAKFQTQIQADATVEQMKAQAKAEAAYVDEKSILNELIFAEEIASEAGNMMAGLDTHTFMKKLTAQLSNYDPEGQMSALKLLQNKGMPTIASLMATRLQLANEFMLQSMPTQVQTQEAQAERSVKQEVSARRASGRSSSTKHTASKRGEPK